MRSFVSGICQYIFFLSILLFLASCNEDTPTEPESSITVHITATPENIRANEILSLEADYSGTLLSEPRFVWSYSDGTVNDTVVKTNTTTHIFTSTGSYTVSVQIFDNINGNLHAEGTATIALSDSVNYAMYVAHTPDPIHENELATFTLQHSDLTLSSARYVWDFGDGTEPVTVYKSSSVMHKFDAPGVYTLSVQAFDNSTNTMFTETKHQIIVTPFIGAFSILIPNGTLHVDQAIDFKLDNNGAAIKKAKYDWDFGDGTASVTRLQDSTESHTYTNTGTYTVTCSIYDSETNTLRSTITKQIQISLYPRPDLTNYIRLTLHGAFEYTGKKKHPFMNVLLDTVFVLDSVFTTCVTKSYFPNDTMIWSGQTLECHYSFTGSKTKILNAAIQLSDDGLSIEDIEIDGSYGYGTMSYPYQETLTFHAQNISLVGSMSRSYARYKIEGTASQQAILALSASIRHSDSGMLMYDYALSDILSSPSGYIEIEFIQY